MKKITFVLLIIYYTTKIVAQDATLIYKNTVSSTVTIETDIGLGSGFFISENVIVTNYHVIEGASEAYCYTNNSSTKYKIEGYLAVDKVVDLILLKVPGLNRKALKIAASSVFPGQKVYVIGSPKGLPATISDGMISGLRDFEGYKLIQITAPISPGSSGGPVLNANGELIGVSVGQFKDGQNLNFAIPKSNLELLLNLKTTDPISITTLYSLTSSFTDDRDGQTYRSIKIGTQIWMAENLKTTQFNDGTSIPYIGLETNLTFWINLSTPAYYWYNNDPTYKVTYGALYNWYTVNTGKLCPTGWHVPSDAEWTILTDYLGGESVAGDKLRETGTTLWQNNNIGANNESGFTALPGGFRNADGSFDGIGDIGEWWSSTAYGRRWSSTGYPRAGLHCAWYRLLGSGVSGVLRADAISQGGNSIRCVKD
jgi:uncharacterized protein (TIGR02145 family)